MDCMVGASLVGASLINEVFSSPLAKSIVVRLGHYWWQDTSQLRTTVITLLSIYVIPNS